MAKSLSEKLTVPARYAFKACTQCLLASPVDPSTTTCPRCRGALRDMHIDEQREYAAWLSRTPFTTDGQPRFLDVWDLA